MIQWLQVGYPDGVPGPDRVALLELLRSSPLLSEEEITGALAVREFYRPTSLDASREGPGGEPSEPLGDQIGVEDPLLETLELRLALQQLLEALPVRLRDLIQLRYFQKMSQRQVGQRLGISQMHVSRLERHALALLRQDLRLALATGETLTVEAIW